MALRFSIRARAVRTEAGGDSGGVERAVDVPFENGEVIMGRKPGDGIELPFPAVSGRHVRLFRAPGGGYAVEDLGSSNGTFLGRRRLLPNTPEPFAVGETLGLAGVEVVFVGEVVATGIGSEVDGTATLARRLVHDLCVSAPPAEAARLVVVEGAHAGCELALPLCGRPFRLGRGESCDLALSDDDVSREHASIERDADGITVRDLDSKNGVEVSGQRIAGPTRLRDGDLLRIGKTSLRVVDPEDRYLRQLQAQDEPASLNSAESPLPIPGPAEGQGLRPRQAPARPAGSLPVVATWVAVFVLILVTGLVLTIAFVP